MRIDREKMDELMSIPNADIKDQLFSHIHLSDTVPEAFAEDMIDIMSFYYDRNGKGYRGVMEEITERVYLYYETADELPVREFMVHRMGQTDMYDRDRRIPYEKKTGCGAWLYCETADLQEAFRVYRRKRTLLRWDYEHEAEEGVKGDHDINIHIECSFKTFFDFLDSYPKGKETFFKYNAKRSKAGLHCFEMQTIKTSGKKIEFLQSFDQWLNS